MPGNCVLIAINLKVHLNYLLVYLLNDAVCFVINFTTKSKNKKTMSLYF